MMGPDLIPSDSNSSSKSEEEKSEEKSQGSLNNLDYSKQLAQRTKGAHFKMAMNPYNKRKKW